MAPLALLIYTVTRGIIYCRLSCSVDNLGVHSLITIKLFNETNQYIARLFIWVAIAACRNRGFH